jgi:hypothetical protein
VSRKFTIVELHDRFIFLLSFIYLIIFPSLFNYFPTRGHHRCFPLALVDCENTFDYFATEFDF